MVKQKGFTLMELVVVIAITAILSTVILLSATQYINKGKDASIAGNLAVLISAGEAYYPSGSGSPNTYANFCSSSAVLNAISQMPENRSVYAACQLNRAGLCCNDDDQEWVACATKFSDTTKYHCVDSRGIQKETSVSCINSFQCQ